MENAAIFKEKHREYGIQALIERYRSVFRVKENPNHYQDEDLRFAEKKFTKYALQECRLDFLQ